MSVNMRMQAPSDPSSILDPLSRFKGNQKGARISRHDEEVIIGRIVRGCPSLVDLFFRLIRDEVHKIISDGKELGA